MGRVNPHNGTKNGSGHTTGTFSDVVRTEKNERIARGALQNLVRFGDTLESEIFEFQMDRENGKPIDDELLEKMLIVRVKYHVVMNGLMELDETSERHALLAFADAAHDMMKFMHRYRTH